MSCGKLLLVFLMGCAVTEGWWWWGSFEPWSYNDEMTRNTKLTSLNLTHELVADAYLKVRHILDIKSYHNYQIDYQVGYIMGQIREKYRRMLEHYYQWRDKASGKSVFAGPGVRNLVGIYWLMNMEYIAMIEYDIRKYIEAVLHYFIDDTLPKYVRPKKKGGKKKSLRMRNEEQALKKRYRAQYMARRLGKPDNYTTKSKRFQNKWPVEETWDNFGPYDIGL